MKLNFKKIIIFLSISIFVAILSLAYFFALPKVINIEKYKPEIRKYLKENVSVPLELGKLDVDMTWNLGLKIKLDKAFLKKENGSKYINIGDSYITVSLLPLMQKHVIIRETVINNLDANIIRLGDGTFDVSKIFKSKGKGKYKVELKDTSINLNNYRINFSDKYMTPEKNFVLGGDNIKIARFSPDKYIEIQAKGMISHMFCRSKASEIKNPDVFFNMYFNADFPFNKKDFTKNRLKIGGNIKNFDLKEIKPYVNQYSPSKFSILSGNGSINFNIDLNREFPGKRKFFIDSVTTNTNIKDALKGNVLSHNGELKLFADGNFDDNDLYLDNFQVDGNKINIDIKGKISNFARKKMRNVDLKANLSNTSAKIAAEVFPKTIKVKLDPFNKILKHNVDGIISGNLLIKGYYRRPELFGKIKYTDLSIIEKIPGIQNSYGSVEFLGPTLVIDSTQYIGKNEFVKTTGSVVPFKGKKVKLSINTTQNINFEKCLPVLLAVRDIFEFKLTPVTEMDIKGIGKANLDIEGPPKEVVINGYVEAKNATVKYATLADKAENVNGKIKFSGEKVYYDDLTGFVEGIKVIPSGYSTLHGYSDMKLYMPNLDLKKGQKFIYGSPLLKKVQFGLKDIIEIKGVADAEIFLKGTEKKLDSRGVLKFTDAYLNYKGYGESFNNLKGQLRYNNEDLFLDNINGTVLGNSVIANGSIGALTKDINMTISSKNIKLEDAKKFVMKSSLLNKPQKIVSDYTFVNGTSAIELILKGKADKDCLKNLIFSDANVVFEQKLIGFPIKISKGTLTITDDTVQTQGIQANAANTDFIVKGKVSNLKANIKSKAPIIPDIELKVKRFDSSTLKEAAKISVIPFKVKKILTEFSQSAVIGANSSDNSNATTAIVRIKPLGFVANINFDNFAMLYNTYDIPVVIESGKLEVTDKTAILSNLKGKLSNSPFFVNGSVKNLLKNPLFAGTTSLEFNQKDSDKISSLIKQPVEIKGSIPLTVNIKGNVNSWNIKSKMLVDRGTSFSYSKQMGLPDDKIKLLTLDAQGKNDRLDIRSLKIDLFEKDKELNSQSIMEYDITGDKENLLLCSGSIDRLTTSKPMFRNFKIYTNNEKPLSVCVLNGGVTSVINNGNEKFFSEGDFKADLTINGYVFNPDVQGFVSFVGLKIPDYKLNINNAKITFDKDNINLDFKGFKIDDSSMNINAVVDYPLQSPLMIRDVKVTSDYMNLDNIAKVVVANKDIINSNSDDIKVLGIVVQNGTLEAKELILRDLITSEAKANLSFTPDGLLSISDIQMKAAGGIGTGNLYYNAKSTELSLNLNAKNMQANALATTLLRFPNEVYGTLSGEGQFYTSGKNSEEMISNSNGYADFKIYDGRLVRLGSLEYFLRAANVLQCGIGGLNFNNIIDLVVPQKTGYFDKLEGKLDIKEGVINTEEITSSGDNLSLYISGNFDMLTNYADAKILGKLSKKVSGLLGPLGSVSVNQFIGYVPGVGFLPTMPGEKGLIDLIPGLSKIPVLGLDFNQKNRQFVVDINGNLYEQSSVKSFRWLD